MIEAQFGVEYIPLSDEQCFHGVFLICNNLFDRLNWDFPKFEEAFRTTSTMRLSQFVSIFWLTLQWTLSQNTDVEKGLFLVAFMIYDKV